MEIRVVIDATPALVRLLERLATAMRGAGPVVAGGEGRRRAGAGAAVDGDAPAPPPSDGAQAAGGVAQSPAVDAPAAEGVAQPPAVAAPAPRGKFRRDLAKSWRTEGRLAALRAAWGTAEAGRVLYRRLGAMEGPPMPASYTAIYGWARELGLGERPATPATARMQALQQKTAAERHQGAWRTVERAELMRRDWGVVNFAELATALAALPGRPMPEGKGTLYRWAEQLGLHVPGQPVANGDTRAGETGAATPERPPQEAGEDAPAMAAEEDAETRTEAPTGAVPVPPAPQPIEEPPPNSGGEVGQVAAQVPTAQRSPAPPQPPPARKPPPAMPPPGPDGLVRVSFAQARAWAAHHGILYNGANMDAVNRRWALLGRRGTVVQDEALR